MRRKILLALFACSAVLTPATGYAQSREHPRGDSWFGADKIKHFLMSAFIESLTFSGLQYAGAHRTAAFAGAIGVTAAFGVGKELHDRRNGEIFSVHDLAWDAAGAGAGLLMLRSTQR